MNGSNATGYSGTYTDPTNSVLFDGHIPTLTGLGGSTWASQLLTLNPNTRTTEITFNFTATPGYSRLERIEVVMFSCPEWGIGEDIIRVLTTPITASGMTPLESHNINQPNSCDSLITVCIPIQTTQPLLALQFHLLESNWIHLAEVMFYGNGNVCPVRAAVSTTTQAYSAERTTQASVEKTTQASVQQTTQASAEQTTQASVEQTTQASVEKTTQAVAGSTTASNRDTTHTPGKGWVSSDTT